MVFDENKQLPNDENPTNSNREGDNLNTEEQEDSANGLDSTTVRGGQNGRNIRGMGSQDMDSENGVLRLNDSGNGAMEIPDEALNNAAASDAQTKTSTVSVTTSGPDDYASNPVVGTPVAQQEAKKQDDEKDAEAADEPSQQETDEDIAQTGTSTDHQPTY